MSRRQDLVLDEGVVPGHQGLGGQRALADAADHLLTAGLDALGDGDLALARQELDRAHLAQIHPHGVVGSADVLVVDVARSRAAAGLLAGFLFLFVGRVFLLFVLDDVDAHLGEHRHRVLDLLGGHLVRRQDLIQFVVGDVAPLLGLLDHLLDGRDGDVHQRAIGALFTRFAGLGGRGCLCCRCHTPFARSLDGPINHNFAKPTLRKG